MIRTFVKYEIHIYFWKFYCINTDFIINFRRQILRIKMYQCLTLFLPLKATRNQK